MTNFFNIAVDEYNKVSDTKITDEDRQELINSFDDEMINNINEELSSINLDSEIPEEYSNYVNLFVSQF